MLSPSPATRVEANAARVLLSASWLLAVSALGILLWMAIAWLRAGAAAFLGRFAEARRRDPLAWVIMLMLLMFGLALGPPHGLWQYVYWMPVFSFIRMSSRFSIVWLLTVGVLAGAGFDRMTRG